jgi:two-component system sensor histidine kinase KdpD
LSDTDKGAAEWSWKNERPAGAGSDTLPAAKWYFLPLKGPKGIIAILATSPKTEDEFVLAPPQRRMLFSYCDQAALAIERALLAEDIEETRILSETEKLRSALLSSISHDLRTPLVSIIGSATSLNELNDSLSPKAKTELLGNVLDEAQRLNRFVQNLLDMTRLGHGNLKPKLEMTEFRDVLGLALKRLEKELKDHPVEIKDSREWDSFMVDRVLMEQVFVNILDNAAKYSPLGTKIKITTLRKDQNINIIFADEGPGIPAKEREQVFDMFYRVRSKDSKVAGTGLGLAICRGLIEVHGGTIHVEAAQAGGKGTAVIISFPVTMSGTAIPRSGKSPWIMNR